MRKIYLLLFIPFLFILSCKKSETPSDPVVEVPELDTSEAFKDVIFSNFRNTNNYFLSDQSDISYLGFMTDIKSVDDLNFNSFNGVRLVNTGFSLTDVEGAVIKEHDLNRAVLSEYRTAINDLKRSTTQSFLPKFSFEIYASSEIVNSSKTNITLVLSAVYYYLNLNPVKDHQFDLSSGVEIDEVKVNGAYLSKIGFGQRHLIKITSDQDPKKVLTYLKAYLNDLIHNDGKKAAELSKGFDISGDGFSVLGGDLLFDVLFEGNIKEKIKIMVKNASESRTFETPFVGIEFEVKNFRKPG